MKKIIAATVAIFLTPIAFAQSCGARQMVDCQTRGIGSAPKTLR